MKLLIAYTLLGTGCYFLFPYIVIAIQIFFFEYIINVAIPPR